MLLIFRTSYWHKCKNMSDVSLDDSSMSHPATDYEKRASAELALKQKHIVKTFCLKMGIC